MGTPRRQFIKTASMFAFALGMPALGHKIAAAATGTATGTSQPAASGNAIDIFKKDSFMPYLNSTFRVGNGSSLMDLRLVKISDIREESKNPRQIRGRENFSLMFQPSGKTAHLSDNVYNLQHASLGTFPMFLVGVGSEVSRKYEATVNRL
jgi:hypothetical protein